MEFNLSVAWAWEMFLYQFLYNLASCWWELTGRLAFRPWVWQVYAHCACSRKMQEMFRLTGHTQDVNHDLVFWSGFNITNNNSDPKVEWADNSGKIINNNKQLQKNMPFPFLTSIISILSCPCSMYIRKTDILFAILLDFWICLENISKMPPSEEA